MPKRADINSVLVIGSGPIVIGQAAEFDYSGTQACRVLREEGVRVILVNSNPATIMTDPDFADATYIEPITWQVIETIIAKEKPDAILPTLGGQTALNAAIELHNHGILEKYDVELIGANFEAINKGEDRQLFKELVRMVGDGLHQSPTTEVLLEESILGWKEYELELMRDTSDNTVVVCSIENVDPVGVHTGDSITVAPALTLTDREYQNLRDIGIDIIRRVGVDTGGCNIQFAIDPVNGRVIVIEMNPRVSRSSALASKATGFPIAKIAAKLAIGYRLDEIPNDITKVTPASFEPTLDYVVVKVPRFAFEKFPAADTRLTTTMKSVGEAMAIGRNYSTALQKALRSLEKRGSSFHWDGAPGDKDALLAIASVPTDGRIVTVQQAMRAGATTEEVFEATKIDPWFIDQIALINEVAAEVASAPELDEAVLRHAKDHGFSDVQVAALRGLSEGEVRGIRWSLGVRPVYKTVDTCAGEFPALTPYHYSSYDLETEVTPSERRKVVILFEFPDLRIDLPDKQDPKKKVNLPRALSVKETLTLASKGNLRPLLESWRGKAFTEAELDGFDLKKLIGANALINVAQETKENRTYANIHTVNPLAQGMKKRTAETPPVFFSFDDVSPSCRKLEFSPNMPQWVQGLLLGSAEAQRISGGHSEAPSDTQKATQQDLDEDVPF